MKYLFLITAIMQFFLAIEGIHSLNDALTNGNLMAALGWGMAFLCQLELDYTKKR